MAGIKSKAIIKLLREAADSLSDDAAEAVGKKVAKTGGDSAGFTEKDILTLTPDVEEKAAKVTAKAKKPDDSTLRQDVEKAVESKIQAPRESTLPERFQSGEKEGIYRGTEAFGGMTPQKLGSARKKYMGDAIEGAPHSKYWYDDTSKVIYDLTGGDVPRSDKLAHALSVTSSTTPVKSNAMFGFKGWNQDLVGDPVHTGKYPTAMSKDIDEGWDALARGEDPEGVGLKRDPYRAGLSVHWRPNPNIRPTNDIHQMRAFGITDPKTGKPWNKGVGEAGHRFIDNQTHWTVDALNKRGRAMQEFGPVRQADQPDWNAYRTQAAAWAPQRVKTGMADTIEEAAGHYGAAVDPHSAHGTREWTPGATTNHFAELLRASPELKREFAEAMESNVRGPEGIDKLASGMGALSAKTLENRGVYEGVTNPGYVTRVPVGKVTGDDVIDPSSAKVMDSVMGAHGLVGVQDQSAWNHLSGQPSGRSFGGATFVADKPFDEQRLAALEGRLKGLGVDIPQVDPRGARVLHFGDQFGDDMATLQSAAQAAGMPAKEAAAVVRKDYKTDIKDRKALINALREAGEDFGAEVELNTSSGNLFPTKPGSTWEKPDTWSSKPFIEKIEAGGPKVVEGFNRTMQGGMASGLLQTAQALAQKHGLTAAPYYRAMMEALATGGLAALKDLVAKGIVPVAVFAIMAEELSGEGAMQ